MRKMKKINGFLVVRFNDREKRVYPELGSFGVIDAEQYVGDIDLDLGEMEYTDAETIELAVEQARGLNAEEDYTDQPTTYAVITETATVSREEEVTPKALALSYEERLKTQVKSRHYPDIDPRTAAHELNGYKTALHHLGLLDADDAITEPDIFGAACALYTDEGHRVDIMLPSKAGLAILSPHDFTEGETFTGCTVQTLKCRRCGMESFAWSKGPSLEQEEALGYVCDELCKFREGRTQEELDAICEKCKIDRWAGAPPTLTAQEARNLRGLLKEVDDYVNGEGSAPSTGKPEPPTLETFKNIYLGVKNDPNVKKVYALGLMLAQECPDNDCRLYLNVFNMAREIDDALDVVGENTAPALVLRRELMEKAGELWQMYEKTPAVQQYKEGIGS